MSQTNTDPRTRGVDGLKGLNTEEGLSLQLNAMRVYLPTTIQGVKAKKAMSPYLYAPVQYFGMDSPDLGKSKYDKEMSSLTLFENLNDSRARLQSAWAKIGTGLGKMAVLTGTTFVDNTLGLVVGLANGINTAANGEGFMKGFINNSLSETLNTINAASEEWMPTYYTDYEREASWSDNLDTASFWGDVILKNMGFTIGMGLSAAITGGAMTAGLAKKGIRDAFKGVVVNSAGKELKTGSLIYKAYKRGDAFMNGFKLTKDLAKSAKLLKRAEIATQFLGGSLSAIGEARFEALNGGNEYIEGARLALDQKHQLYGAEIMQLMYEKNPEDFTVDEDGTMKIVNPDTLYDYEVLMLQENEKYLQALKDIENLKQAVQNSIFGLNWALLSFSNIWQLGRALSGGYKTGRNFANSITGDIAGGFNATTSKNIGKSIAKGISNIAVEANEEMAQGGISTGSKLWQGSKLNNKIGSFYGGKIDENAEQETQEWLNSVTEGFSTFYGDFENWQEGFAGGFMGAVGIPIVKMKATSKGKRPSVSIEGGLWGELSNTIKLNKEAKSIADALNARVLKPEFMNYYQGHIRHIKAGNDKALALKRGDEFDYKNAEVYQIVSDAIMFERAGKLEEFYDMIDGTADISDEDIAEIRLIVDKKTGKSIYEGMTDLLIKDLMAKQAKDTRKLVETYSKIANDLKVLYGDNISKDVLEELSWGMTQVDNWESRLTDIMLSIRNHLRYKNGELVHKFGVNVEIILHNIEDFKNAFNEDKDLIEEINQIVADKTLSTEKQRKQISAAIDKANLKRAESKKKFIQRTSKLKEKFLNREKTFEKKLDLLIKKRKKLEAEQRRLEDLRDLELADQEELGFKAEELIEVLELHRDATTKKGQLPHPVYQDKIDELRNMIQGNIEDIQNSFKLVIDNIYKTLEEEERMWLESKIKDKRFKKGYNPDFQEYTAANGAVMSESLHEATQQYVAEQEGLLNQIELLTEDLNKITIKPLDSKIIRELLYDMIKILAARESFLDTYLTLSKKPELLSEQFYKLIEEGLKAAKAKEVGKAVTGLKIEEDITLEDLKSKLESLEDQSLVSEVLDALEKEASPTLKKTIKSYKELKEFETLIFGDLTGPGIMDTVRTPEISDAVYDYALELLKSKLDKASSIKSLIADLEAELNTADESVKDYFENIFKKYFSIKQSKRSKKKDKNAKKELKNEKNSKENKQEEDEENEGEEDLEKQKGEEGIEKENKKSEKKKSIFEDLDDDTEALERAYRADLEESEKSEKDNEKKEAEDDEEKNVEEDDNNLIKKLKKLSKNELKSIIDGTSDFLKGLAEDIKELIKEYAKLILNTSTHKSAISNIQHQTPEENTATIDTSSPVYISTSVTGYEVAPLKNDKRKAIPLNHPVANFLREKGAYDFVDSGQLAILLKVNPNLTIHYITAPEVAEISGGVLLAIEVTPEVRGQVTIPNSIKGSNGKTYLIVGFLGYRKAAAGIVEDNYNALLEGLAEERGDNTEGFIVSKKYTNTVSHIYSGRIVKTDADNPTVQQRSIKSILKPGNIPHIAIYIGDKLVSSTLGQQEQLVSLNKNNTNPKEGSVWLYVREADGRFYPKAIQVKRFSNDEWDFKKHKTSQRMIDIRKQLSIIANPEISDYERSKAKYFLQQHLLYFPPGTNILFKDDIISITDEDGNIFKDIGKGLDVEDKVDALIEALGTLNLRFQVSSMLLEQLGIYYALELVDEDILVTDLLYPNNVNASFDMPLLDPETGKPLSKSEKVATGHIGKKGIKGSPQTRTVIVGNNRYTVSEDGVVMKGDELLQSNSKEAQEIIFKDKINRKMISPVKGNKNLYIGAYTDSTLFGFLNGKLIKGEELKLQLNIAEARQAKKELREALQRATEEAKENEKDESEGTFTGDIEVAEEADAASIFGSKAPLDPLDALDAKSEKKPKKRFSLFDLEDIEDEEDEGIEKETSKPASIETLGTALQEVVTEFVITNPERMDEVQGLEEKARAAGIDISTVDTIEKLEGVLDKLKCS